MASGHTIAFIIGKDDELRISVDAPGVAAVSAPVGDPMEFIRVFASQADLEYDDAQLPDSIVISVPPGS
jgi:hypothetical protein